MYPLILSAIMTCSIYLAHSWFKCKQKAYVYFILFVGLAAIDYVLDYAWKANASEELRTHFAMQAENDKKPKRKKSIREIHEDYLYRCECLQEYHREEAIRCYGDVENLCNQFTNVDDREKSGMILRSTFAAASPGTPTFRIFVAAMLLLEQYFSDRWHEMQLVQVKLAQAQSHAELYEHYRVTRRYIKDQIALEPRLSTTIVIGE